MDERSSSLDGRIDARWMPEPNTGCWIWLASVDRDKRPVIRSGVGDNKIAVRRAILERETGTVLGSDQLVATCGNTRCVNPDHSVRRSTLPRLSGDVVARVAARSVPQPNGCRLWQGRVDRSGYGRILNRGAHRVLYEAVHGKLPPGMVVRHSCDTPLCVEISHLSHGTHADNVADRDARGRTAKGDNHYTRRVPGWTVQGSRNGMAKLNADAVMAIRAADRSGVPREAIAATHGVCVRTVVLVATYVRWKHVA